jgi:excisionase family DNA binding protein
MSMEVANKEYLSAADVATVLGISPSTARLVIISYIPHVKIGGKFRVSRVDLDEYIAKIKIKPTTQGW